MKPFSLLAILALAYPAALHAEQVQGLVLPFTEVFVSSPVLQDVIKDIAVNEGDTVKKDQVLAHLLNDRETLDAQRYENLIKRAQFQYNGMKKLADEKYASQDDLLAKETDLKAAQLDYQIALTALEEKTIKSPLSGIVVQRYKEPGEAVDRAEKLFDIVDIDQVYVRVYVEPAILEKLAVGDKISVHIPDIFHGPQDFTGSVSFIAPNVDAASGEFRVKILIDNPNHLIKAGMRAQADFNKPPTGTASAS
jgi:RND family efflux transporter MFP subunit